METTIRIEVKPYTSKELAQMFNASKSTFNRDLQPHREKLGKRIGHRWSILQVELIMAILGRPYQVIEQDTLPTIIKVLPPKQRHTIIGQDDGDLPQAA